MRDLLGKREARGEEDNKKRRNIQRKKWTKFSGFCGQMRKANIGIVEIQSLEGVTVHWDNERKPPQRHTLIGVCVFTGILGLGRQLFAKGSLSRSQANIAIPLRRVLPNPFIIQLGECVTDCQRDAI